MMKNPLGNIAACVAMIVAVMLASCSGGKSDMLELVPADAQVVATLNLTKLLESAGCKVENDKVTLSAELSQLVDNSDFKENRDKIDRILLSGCIGLDRVVAFHKDAMQKPVVIVKVNDADVFGELLVAAGYTAVDMNNGYHGYVRQDENWLIKDGMGWLVTCGFRDDPVAVLDGLLDDAGRKSVASVGWKADLLGKDGFANSIISIPFPLDAFYGDDKYRNVSYYAGSDFDGNKVEAEYAVYSADGKRLELLPGADDIDTGFLKYLTEDDIAAIAIGVSGDADWNSWLRSFDPTLPRDARMVAPMALPYLKNLDGTVAVAGGPVNGAKSFERPSLADWSFIAMAKMKDDAAETIVLQVKALAGQSGMGTVNEVDGGFSIYIPREGTLYLVARDGYLMLSNREVTGNGSTALNPSWFKGRSLALGLSVHKDSKIFAQYGVPFGVSLDGGVDGDECNGRIVLDGTGQSFVEAIVSYAIGMASSK